MAQLPPPAHLPQNGAIIRKTECQSIFPTSCQWHKVTQEPDSTPSNNIATSDWLEAFCAHHPLPECRIRPCDVLRHAGLTFYRRLMIVTTLGNTVAFVIMIIRAVERPSTFTYAAAATAISANLFVAILMRHEHYINFIFWLVTRLPQSTPLQARRACAKFAYSQGGIHSGAGCSAFAWYLFYVVLVCREFEPGRPEGYALAAISSLTVLLIFILVASSHPTIRTMRHDLWEANIALVGMLPLLLFGFKSSLRLSTRRTPPAERQFYGFQRFGF